MFTQQLPGIKRLTLLLTMLLCVATTCAQQHQLSISLNPTALIDEFSFPAIQMGLQYKLSNRISLLTEASFSYRKPLAYKSDTTILPFSGIRLKAEVKYYLSHFPLFLVHNNQDNNGYKAYLSTNLYYKKEKRTSHVFYYSNPDAEDYKTDFLGVSKNVGG